MKRVLHISLGASRDDYELETHFLGQRFHIQRIGTDGRLEKAAELLLKLNKKVDAIALGGMRFPYTIGRGPQLEKETEELAKLAAHMHTPVTTGAAMRTVVHEWSIRHLQFKFGNNYFTNARILFFSGLANSTLAQVLSEFTENLLFADPVFEDGIPRLLTSLKELGSYAERIHPLLEWLPARRISMKADALRSWGDRTVRKALGAAAMAVIPYYGFYRYVEPYTAKEFEGKVVVTSTAYDDRVALLKERRVDVIIDTTPKVLDRVVGVSVLEAMALVALKKDTYQITDDDLLEIICDQRMEPRVIYPCGYEKRVNRFAFVMMPPATGRDREESPRHGGREGKRYFPILSQVAGAIAGGDLERAFSPSGGPFVYSTVKGIRSQTGVEAQGWLISAGLGEEDLYDRSAEFIETRLLDAVRLAKRLGAQVAGLGQLPREMGKVAVDLSKRADIPVTTGNSYVASSALWAAAEVVRRMGIIRRKDRKILKAKTMVIGATGDVGSICCRLLAKAFEEVYMVSRNIAKLLALQEAVRQESPAARVVVSTRADRYLGEMDVIVAASAGARRSLELGMVKPGCVITDVNRPMIFSAEDARKRPDVLVIGSGEILVPGEEVAMKDIGLPPRVVPAGLAETIVLALEGRFEVFTVGSETQWEKVREIYRLGLKHGMRLSAISGVFGVITDADIAAVRDMVLLARKQRRAETATSGRGRPKRSGHQDRPLE